MSNKIKIARSNERDIESTSRFLEIAEFLFNTENIEALAESEPTRMLYESIKKEIGFGNNVTTEQEIEIRFEILKRLFIDCSGRWIKVVNTAEIMSEQICDKSVSYISLEPFLKRAVEGALFGE